MKILRTIVVSVFAIAVPSLAIAADFGGEEAPPQEAFVAPIPPPVLFARPYNYVYEENGIYYAPPYQLPYFGLFPQWGPQVAFYPQPYWQPPPRPVRPHGRRRW